MQSGGDCRLLTQEEIEILLYGAPREDSADLQKRKPVEDRAKSEPKERASDRRNGKRGCERMNGAIYDMIRDAVSRQKADSCDPDAIWEIFSYLLEFSRISSVEGLLSLEEEIIQFVEEKKAADQDEDTASDPDVVSVGRYSHWNYLYTELSGVYRFLAMMIMYVVDGTMPEYLEEIAIMHYYASGYEGVDALLACMITVGVLDLQAGMHPILLQERLLAMLPEKTANQIIARERERETK